ncbi:MAG TPA: hemerythrin domain-containing protein [Dongiaceae bacterium]
MGTGHSPGRGRQLASLPENLFRAPIDYLIADHARIRAMCDGLDLLARGTEQHADPDAAAHTAAFLERDLPRHFLDEEAVLAPQLRRTWPASGQAVLERDLQRLQEQHRHDTALRLRLLPILRRLAAGTLAVADKEFGMRCTAFTVSLRRNLAWEEETILKAAQRFLGASVLDRVGRAMSAGHGVAFPEFE